ncbi:MAG: outer membrane protein assembly factor BamD [Alphaproteobacteria bacterium]|nr:outer membrane protein assembly factor BamD [Alphaproteobacteria bacterium]
MAGGCSTEKRNTALGVRPMAVAFAAFMVTACASSDIKTTLNPDPPEKIYASADALMTQGKFEEAAKKFEDLDRSHPYAPEARRSMVLAAYSYYKAGKLPEAVVAAERYTTMHPGTKDAPLAHHIIASSYFDEMKKPNRDQSSTLKAVRELKKLRSLYPESKYAKIAENRLRLAEDTLAASEMEVGRYYMKRNNHVGAINRFRTVVSKYQTTAHVEEALMRLTESYMALGVVNEAQTAAAVLGHNFPQSPWYKDAYALLQSGGLAPREDGGSWISKTWKSLPSFSLGGPKKG